MSTVAVEHDSAQTTCGPLQNTRNGVPRAPTAGRYVLFAYPKAVQPQDFFVIGHSYDLLWIY